MLVLSRRPGEQVVIDGQIIVTVLEVRGRSIKLGFNAPPDVSLLRGELIHQDQDAHEHDLAGLTS